MFSFSQSKTDAQVIIEVSPALRAKLNAMGKGQMSLFRNKTTGKAYIESALYKMFDKVREKVIADGGRFLLLKWLRHSCVVRLARAG